MAGLEDLLMGFIPKNSQDPLQALLAPRFTDEYSPTEYANQYREMLRRRAQTRTPTIDPGVTWGGMDKNAVQPSDIMQSLFYNHYDENI